MERFEDIHLAPEAAKPFLLDFSWSLDKLRALPLEPVELPLSALTACLAAPLWRSGGRPFALAPLELLKDPSLDRDQYERVLNAELDHPLYALRQEGRWLVLDGTHRLAKALKLGYEDVQVKVVPKTMLERIAV